MVDKIEEAAVRVHDAWMRRNPKGDHNASQHVPFHELDERNKALDVQQVTAVLQAVTVHRREFAALLGDGSGEQQQQQLSALEDTVAGKFHGDWLATCGYTERWKPLREGGVREEYVAKGVDRVGPNDKNETNICVAWTDLHPEWKVENLAAARAAVRIVLSLG